MTVRVVFGDVFDERRAETKIEEVKRIDKDTQDDPRTEVPNVEMRQNVRGQKQRDEETPRTADQIEKSVRDEPFGKLALERNGLMIDAHVAYNSLFAFI